jgi:hypothetical protein
MQVTAAPSVFLPPRAFVLPPDPAALVHRIRTVEEEAAEREAPRRRARAVAERRDETRAAVARRP